MKEELISVIVPVYRVERYLKKCLDSILSQTYTNMQIIIVDDGSDDECPQICDDYAKSDRRIEVIHKRNAGLSSARNVGIENATGEYITFIDSDDYIDSRYVEVLYTSLVQNSCDIAQCGSKDVFSDFTVVDEINGEYHVYSRNAFIAAVYSYMGKAIMAAWGKLYRTELFGTLRYPRGKTHEDEYVTYRLICNAEKIVDIKTRLYFYRQRDDSIMGQAWNEKRLDAMEALRAQEMYYIEHGMDAILINLCQNRYLEWLDYHLPEALRHGSVEPEILKKMSTEKQRLENILKNHRVQVLGSNHHGYLFPYDRVKKGERIILYGAGERGNIFYRQICATNYCSVAAWVDRSDEYYRQLGYPVTQMKDVKYAGEKIVLAVNTYKVANQIMEMLMGEYFIPKEKIIFEQYEF